ncbi:MAG: prepilin peptidase [Gemmataceae bacterium]|nr:prepilin peptidase [Gemmataceae bacterium]
MSNFLLNYGMLLLLHVALFVFGAIVGSFINVWVARLPYEKSILWPLGSRCGQCYAVIRWYDNIPLLSYWLLRGRCRHCQAEFSIRYFLIELIVALGFPVIFYVEVIQNIHDFNAFQNTLQHLRYGLFARENIPAYLFFSHRAILFSLLVAAAGCDLNRRTIPLQLTMIGTLIGLLYGISFPWPWPNGIAVSLPRPRAGIDDWWSLQPNEMQRSGLYPWPVWGPLPSWIPPGSWQLGLATSLAGAIAGTALLRSVKFLFERGLGREALGLGDADLMMMAGAFLGWQVVVMSFLAGGVITLLISLPSLFRRDEQELPFGPGLAAGCITTWVGWELIAPHIQVLFFHPTFLTLFALGCGGVILVMSFLFGTLRGTATSGTES